MNPASVTEFVFRQDAYRRSCTARIVAAHAGESEATWLELDATVFYPAGGGQPGDTGRLQLPDGSALQVIDTGKGDANDQVLHRLAPGSPVPSSGTTVEASIDWERRYRHMRLHTCLHLLCAVIPAPVTGGRIAQDKAHLDFDIQMDDLDKQAIEMQLNALIASGHTATPRWISDAELEANPQLVRTMSVAPPRGTGQVRLIDIPGVDLQPCAGTHVANTREIGPVRITRIRSEGKHNKRVTLVFAASPAARTHFASGHQTGNSSSQTRPRRA